MKIIKINSDNKEKTILKAVNILKKGGLVIFPTETVYGLGAEAFNKKAVLKIFKAKNRPLTQPLQLLIADTKDAKKLSQKIPRKVAGIMKKFWPGPLTIVLKKKEIVSNIVSGGLNTVGIRMPNHPIALDLIRAFGGPIAATSANISGKKPPKTAREALRYFKRGIDLVLDAGKAKTGKASKVVDASKKRIRVLRD
jgi:L-threonylcarbamoyladenylate synthase